METCLQYKNAVLLGAGYSSLSSTTLEAMQRTMYSADLFKYVNVKYVFNFL